MFGFKLEGAVEHNAPKELRRAIDTLLPEFEDMYGASIERPRVRREGSRSYLLSDPLHDGEFEEEEDYRPGEVVIGPDRYWKSDLWRLAGLGLYASVEQADLDPRVDEEEFRNYAVDRYWEEKKGRTDEVMEKLGFEARVSITH